MAQTIAEWCQSMVDHEELSPTEYIRFAMLGAVPRTAAGMERLRKSIKQRVGERMTNQPDMINHPPHYTSCPSGIECIEIAELLPFCLGNCYKYLHRAGLKGDVLPDLQKAAFYARRAHLNNERLTETARIRIAEVARHHAGDKQEILTHLAQISLGAFYKYLSSYVSKYNTGLDNRPA